MLISFLNIWNKRLINALIWINFLVDRNLGHFLANQFAIRITLLRMLGTSDLPNRIFEYDVVI